MLGAKKFGLDLPNSVAVQQPGKKTLANRIERQTLDVACHVLVRNADLDTQAVSPVFTGAVFPLVSKPRKKR